MRGAPDWHPATEALREACAKAALFCDKQGYPIEKLAMQFSTSLNDHIATTLFSSANPANVLKNIEYVNEPMDEQLVKEVQKIAIRKGRTIITPIIHMSRNSLSKYLGLM